MYIEYVSSIEFSVIVGHAILAEERIDKDGKIIGFNSDLKMLEHNCAEVGLVKEFEAVHFIDTFNIFANNAIKGSLYNRYRLSHQFIRRYISGLCR